MTNYTITCPCSRVITTSTNTYGWQKCNCGIKISYGGEKFPRVGNVIERDIKFIREIGKYILHSYVNEKTVWLYIKGKVSSIPICQDVNFLLRNDLTEDKIDKLLMLK